MVAIAADAADTGIHTYGMANSMPEYNPDLLAYTDAVHSNMFEIELVIVIAVADSLSADAQRSAHFHSTAVLRT